MGAGRRRRSYFILSEMAGSGSLRLFTLIILFAHRTTEQCDRYDRADQSRCQFTHPPAKCKIARHNAKLSRYFNQVELDEQPGKIPQGIFSAFM
jgi:hypothetical protein